MSGKFGILVEIEIERVCVGIDTFNFFGRRSLRARNCTEQCEQQEFGPSHGPGSYPARSRSANSTCQKSTWLQRIPEGDHPICRQYNSPLAFFPPGVQSA